MPPAVALTQGAPLLPDREIPHKLRRLANHLVLGLFKPIGMRRERLPAV